MRLPVSIALFILSSTLFSSAIPVGPHPQTQTSNPSESPDSVEKNPAPQSQQNAPSFPVEKDATPQSQQTTDSGARTSSVKKNATPQPQQTNGGNPPASRWCQICNFLSINPDNPFGFNNENRRRAMLGVAGGFMNPLIFDDPRPRVIQDNTRNTESAPDTSESPDAV